MSSTPAARDLPGPKPAEGKPLVQGIDLVKVYQQGRGGSRAYQVRAVDRVDITIQPGESFGLVGESGSGKSTLGRLLLGLERPTSGQVVFDGRDLRMASARQLQQLRRQMQMVFQDPIGSLNRRKTVEKIVAAPLVVHGMGSTSERQARVGELLELVGLNKRLAAGFPSELSGGQAQRVGIARALALKPTFVVFDEAVSSLDVSVRGQVLNLVRKLQAELGLTYLFISHDLAIVRYMSTRVAVMYRGGIVESAKRAELFTNPRHPYTHELLRAIPEANPSAVTRRRQLTVLDAALDHSVVGGCPFRARCPIGKALEVCEKVTPPLEPIRNGHLVACHFAETSPQRLRELQASGT